LHTSTGIPGGAAAEDLVGRGRELAELERLVRLSPLTCVVGPPGVGKTRLALAYLARAPRRWRRWFCDLREAGELADVWHLLGECIGEPIAAAHSDEARLELLAARLSEREGVLVLDNFEQLAPLAPRLLEPLLERRPLARLIVTSRVRLALDGERCLRLAPLEVEAAGRSPLDCDAVMLFVKRARQMRSDLSFPAPRLAAVEALVRMLDGLPLAIELAAARLRVMEVEQLVEREGGPGGVTTHDALQRSIDASWRLLDPDEKSGLARCAYFRGGFTLEAAESILADDVAPARVAGLLDRLLDCALLRVASTEDGPPERRFSMLTAIREFSEEKLEELGVLEETRRRHRAYFLGRGERWAEEAEGPRAAEALAHLGRERQNLLRVHADAASAPADFLAAPRAALCLDALLLRTGPYEHRLGLLDRALALAGLERDRAIGARALAARAHARQMLGRGNDALEDYERSVELARASGDSGVVVTVLRNFGGSLYQLGHLDRAEEVLREVVAGHRGGEDPATLSNLGICLANRGKTIEAQEVFRRAVRAARRAGNRRREAIALGNLGSTELESGDRIAARAHYEQALAIQREQGDRAAETHLVGSLALLDLEERKLDDAARRIDEAREVACATGNRLYEGMIALLQALRLELQGEEAASFRKYEAALAVLEGAAPAQIDAVALAALGALQASGGAVAAARERLEQAALRVKGGHPRYRRAVELARVHVELAARLADPIDAEAQDRAIEETLARARELVAEHPSVYAASALSRLERFASAARARLAVQTAAAREPAVTVAADGSWFRLAGGDEVSLRRRRALRRVLAALAESADQGRARSLEELFERGWPGERAGDQAAANRVHNALATLRKMGLRDSLVRDDGGYRLAGTAVVAI
jgi:predicted ATPase